MVSRARLVIDVAPAHFGDCDMHSALFGKENLSR